MQKRHIEQIQQQEENDKQDQELDEITTTINITMSNNKKYVSEKAPLINNRHDDDDHRTQQYDYSLNNNNNSPAAASAGASPSKALANLQNKNNQFTEEEMQKHIRAKTSLIIAIVFCCIFMIVELVSGIIAHSLAIMTDAAHMLTDVGSLALSLFAVIASQWEASDQFTFGFKRAEVVGALFSIMLVWGLVGVIIYEAIMRLITIVQCAQGTQDQYTECEGTEPRLMLIVGCLGLVVNIGYAIILAWGGAEVKHAHSHGGDGDDDDHGHSHGGGHGHGKKAAHSSHHGHSHDHDDHGHSHDHGDHHDDHEEEESFEKVKCCEPSKEELACNDRKCDHSGLKNGKLKAPQKFNLLDSPASQASLQTIPKFPSELENHHGHSHGAGGGCDDHDDHGHSHGDHHHDHDDHDHDHDHDHGHSHSHGSPSALAEAGSACDHDHDHDHHGHSHGGHDDHDDHHGHSHDHGGHHGDDGGHHDEEDDHHNVNLNIKGAAVHALGDCLQSIGVIIAAGIIWGGCGVGGNPHSYYNVADPACSLLFAVITLWTTKSLFVEVFGILMERAPRGVHVSCIKRKLEHFDVVVEVKDIFIWSITNDRTALGAHVVMCREATADEIFKTLDKIRTMCTALGFSVSAVEVLREGSDSAENFVPGNGMLSSPSPAGSASPQFPVTATKVGTTTTSCKNPMHAHKKKE